MVSYIVYTIAKSREFEHRLMAVLLDPLPFSNENADHGSSAILSPL